MTSNNTQIKRRKSSDNSLELPSKKLPLTHQSDLIPAPPTGFYRALGVLETSAGMFEQVREQPRSLRRLWLAPPTQPRQAAAKIYF